LKGIIKNGVEGFWNDMNEPAAWGQHLPDLIEFDYDGEGATHKKARNVYGMQMARSTFEGAKNQLNGKRPFVLTRAGFCGIQRYAAVWTGDNVSSDEHMMAGVRLINSMGLAGVPYAGYDVGGFAGEPSPELFARWVALGAFSPFFRAHSMVNSRDSEPWSFGEEVEDISRNFINLRYRLMPYIYSSFYESSQNGMPVARSLAIDYTHDEHIYQHTYQHQYLFGQSILVIPVESNKEFAKVYLPEGKWLNFYTDELLDGGKEMIVEVPKEIIPLYIKAGSIIPMQSLVPYLKRKPSKQMELHVFAGADGQFVYYEDDGETYQFENGEYFKREVNLNHSGAQLMISESTGNYRSHFTEIKIYLHGVESNKKFTLNGKEISSSTEDVKYIEPISDFDPYHKPPKPPMLIKDVPVVNIPNESKQMIIKWS
jgi:alpha-glucosidase